MKPVTIRVNGIPRDSIGALDRGIQYGDGLFATLRVSGGEPEHLPRHLTRLQAGCQRLRFPAIPWETLAQEVAELAAQLPDAALKIILTRGPGARGYRFDTAQQPTRLLTLSPLPEWPADVGQRGIRARVCQTRLCAQPLLAGIKHLNRLEQVLARAEWDDPAIHEGLMMDHDGHLIEGTMSNLFLVEPGSLVTPALTSCGVAGIMRSVILDLARQLGVNTEIRSLTLEEVQRASEAFVCNSLIGIWPVCSIERLAAYPIGPITRALTERLASHCESGEGTWYPS